LRDLSRGWRSVGVEGVGRCTFVGKVVMGKQKEPGNRDRVREREKRLANWIPEESRERERERERERDRKDLETEI
jgi:hypothetical protein